MQDRSIEQRTRAAYRARACAAGVACGAQIFAVGTGLTVPLALNAAYGAAVPALLLGNTLFGGSSNSKLFLNVREKLSLCYYASSTYVRSKGILTVSSGIETADYDRAEAEILRQLDEIRQGLWEDWELTAARESLLSALQALGDSQGALENYYLGQSATGRRETPEEMAALLRQVTPERIRAAAQSVQLDTIYFLKGKEA